MGIAIEPLPRNGSSAPSFLWFVAERTVEINIVDSVSLAFIMTGFITESAGLNFLVKGWVVRSIRYQATAAARRHFAVGR